MGDLHQPLHVSGKLRGGNGASVKFHGKSQNLHQVWDSSFIHYRVQYDFGGNYLRYQNYLMNLTKPESLSFSPTIQQMLFETRKPCIFCPEEWASQINNLNCQLVWKGWSPDIEVSGKYYEDSIEALEALVVLSGTRMAGVLNFLFDRQFSSYY
jgi:hypothetical protein